LIPLLHYTLRPSGFLSLDSPESIGGSKELFRVAGRTQAITRAVKRGIARLNADSA
jgi:hypothetical protein